MIPARAGSQRLPRKNLLPLGGHPLIAYAIAGAHESALFDEVLVSTDSEEVADVARSYGALVPGLRPPALATTTSPDIDWVLHTMRDRNEEVFSILRPTSPFRTGSTIQRAFRRFQELSDRIDSLRAVEPCRQHPAKMWVLDGDLMSPLLNQPERETPLHSRQYQSLPPVYVQNSSLEIAWSRVLEDDPPTISGRRVAPFVTAGAEGFSIDYPEDVATAERFVADGVRLPAPAVRTGA